ncbi:MAG: hypothetical protein A3F83_13405 [Candidatus Glassbacteria bacterium RIFCSPLOWO2_12_FULL_58_11]|uniref:Xylose isomerase-like TIM barrel domain-containing protein n=1 Tax=Candidatus Glassbacteria bacterium RIFCSPLOWO2_12_FULL_58_11 TaxID=1817867 RepID=A0A1F5YMK5_9BACT|nr:MAG: hypothetical protein A3F83_13405 [Candidatus Glassbacteria bacterium RIFCSPLOWO2_12_FULL_58_11]
MKEPNRRNFLKSSLAAGGALAALGEALPAKADAAAGEKKFKISLAAWSLHNEFRTTWTNLDLPMIAREEFGLEGVEFVNSFFEAPRLVYLKELRKRADHYGVELVLIMCDGEGDMAHEDQREREQAVISHYKWVDAAHFLGCKAIRGNAGYTTAGTVDERVKRCAGSYRKLCEYADQAGINVLIENHGGFSSIPEKMLAIMKQVDHPRIGTLPDFGNFPPEVDRFAAIKALLPYASTSVSAKCYDFDAQGRHIAFDMDRMIKEVIDSGYHSGYIGIEFEGEKTSPHDGVLACKKYLERYQ